ncbi:MAG: hypothetical protein KBS89_00540 [Bacteroidales bacterium]|nr:hypothetical protein [Candidatus Egerieousia equi]
MKNFKVIESSRLNNLDMQNIHGGWLVCAPKETYHPQDECYANYCICSNYDSCKGNNHRTCTGFYSGPQGGDGMTQMSSITLD